MADKKLSVTASQINNGVTKANAINGTASEINEKLNSITNKSWVYVGKTISTHTITTYTDKEEIDLSDYLPNDNKQYECSFSLYGSATKSNDKRHVICIKGDLFPNSSFYVLRQMASTEFGVSLTVPVGTPRRIYLACGCGETGFTHTVAIHFLGYKEV